MKCGSDGHCCDLEMLDLKTITAKIGVDVIWSESAREISPVTWLRTVRTLRSSPTGNTASFVSHGQPYRLISLMALSGGHCGFLYQAARALTDARFIRKPVISYWRIDGRFRAIFPNPR